MAMICIVVDGPEELDLERHMGHDYAFIDSDYFRNYMAMVDESREGPVVHGVFRIETEARENAMIPDARMVSAELFSFVVIADPSQWSLSVSYGQLLDRSGTATSLLANGGTWPSDGATYPYLEDEESETLLHAPAGLLATLGDWFDRTFGEANQSTARLLHLTEELLLHLRNSLEEREELLQRLISALGSNQHAEDRVRVLEMQVSALQAQLLEANAAVASGDQKLINQSKVSLVAMATVVISLMAVAVAVAQPFISDKLSNDDTASIVDAIEAIEDPTPIELSVTTALQCVIVDDGPTP